MNLKNLSPSLLVLALLLAGCSEENAVSVDTLGASDVFKEGVHYELLSKPSKVRDINKIEVAEVFWFGCNHCYALESYLNQWEPKLPDDVNFWKSHATWNEVLKIHARMFYTARALGVDQQFVPAAFNTIQNEGRSLTGNTELEYYFKGFGVSKDKYNSVATSFGVNNAVKQANQRMKDWNITGVPTLIVNGKYKVSASRKVNTDGLLDVVDFLIEKERKLLTNQ